MRLHLSAEVPEEVAYLPILRKMTRETLAFGKVCAQDVDDVELLIGELATNAVRHARAGQYRVDIDLTSEKVVVTVADAGTGFQRGAVPAPGTLRPDSMGDERVGGLGLPMVELLADSVSYHRMNPHGTMVQAIKALHPSLA
jgi:anti-sigma regulatory factor (Ser/Thr protein kinase)